MGKASRKKTKTAAPTTTSTTTNSTVIKAAGAGLAVLLLGSLISWFLNRPTYLFNIQVEPMADLIQAIEATSTQTDGSNKFKLATDAVFVGTSHTTGTRGMFARRDVKKGESLITLPDSTILQASEIYPAASWETKLKALRLKGYPKSKSTSIDVHHQLALGVMGCSLKQVTGNKVNLARAYYKFNAKHHPANAYQYWKSHHRKFLNSMPHYAELNTPPRGATQSWPVFNQYFRTQFPHFKTAQAKDLYTMVTSNAIEIGTGAVVLLPVIDAARLSGTPTANLTCTHGKGCELVALSDVKAGEAITHEFQPGSNLYFLQRYGYDAGESHQNVGSGVTHGACSVHFESLAAFPDTGGIRPTEWACLTAEATNVPSKMLAWAKRERQKCHQLLTAARVDLLAGKTDALSVALLRHHSEELNTFNLKEEAVAFVALLAEANKEETKEIDRVFWEKKTAGVFEAGMAKFAKAKEDDKKNWEKKANTAFGRL